MTAANKIVEDHADIGFAEDMKDLPMFKDQNNRIEEEAKEGELS